MVIRYIQRVSATFGGMDAASRSTRELVRRLQAPKMVENNPKCTFKVSVVENLPPTVSVVFNNSQEVTFDMAEKRADQVVKDLEAIARKEQVPVAQ